MLRKTDKTVTLVGASGREYVFKLFTFDDFNDVKGAFESKAALYVFGQLNEDQTKFTRVYLGETDDLKARFDNHHKEDCIRYHGANCIGICDEEEFKDEAKRKAAEKDLLDVMNFPCNDKNN